MSDFKDFEQAAWERKASRYDDTWGSVTSQPIEKVLALVDARKNASLLDIGCGPGHFCDAAFKLGMQVAGCDYSSEMLKIARENYPNYSFTQADAEALSIQNDSFDIVILNYLLLHVSNQNKVLTEANRILKPEGKLAFTIWLAPTESPGLGLIFSALKQFADMSVIPPAQNLFEYSSEDRARDFLSKIGFNEIQAFRFETAWHISKNFSKLCKQGPELED
jgi:ubiquinone/menaquinone biosynthesis C-methylase UbiE